MIRNLIIAAIWVCCSTFIFGQTSEFTYQANLAISGVPANGNFDFEFALFDALSSGSQLGSTLSRNGVVIANGAFAVKLDFGTQFPGANRYLEIRVRNAGGGSFTTLTPRQQINSSPYSIKSTSAENAATATTAVNATQLGGVAANQYLQTNGNGSALTNLNAGNITTGTLAVANGGTGSATLSFVDLSTDQTTIGGNKTFTGILSGNIISAATQFNIGPNRVLATPSGNLFAGLGAGAFTSSGTNNVFAGPGAGQGTVSGNNNTFVGRQAGNGNITGSSNTLIGSGTTLSASDLVVATAIGAGATVGSSNTVVLGRSVDSVQVPGNLNVTGTVAGRGTLPWQAVSGNSQQAQTNNGYMATNDAQVTITLPANPNVGDLVRVSGSGIGGWKVVGNPGQFIVSNIGSAGENWVPHESNRTWSAVASSADGTKLVATVDSGQIYTSTDSGTSWTPRGPVDDWKAVASSADGTRLVASPGGTIQTSSDSGATWTPHGPIGAWFGVASSADGQKLVAAQCGGQIHTSTDFGVTWTPRGASKCWQSVASSSDGTKLIAAASDDNSPNQNPEPIYLSNDSGVTWTPAPGPGARHWWYVASSGNGNTLIAIAQSSGDNWISTDSGANWTKRETDKSWYRAASSDDGTKLVAVIYGGQIYTSIDSGLTWRVRESVRNWNAVASSADGTKLVAAGGPGLIYTATILDVPNGRAKYVVGGQYSSIELQYIGGGIFLPISQIGTPVAFY